jgi:putative tricarboxylic transport membrane protein
MVMWGLTPGPMLFIEQPDFVWGLISSFYTANFASYAKTYGSLATIVVLLLWLWLSALVVLVGAEFDAARD